MDFPLIEAEKDLLSKLYEAWWTHGHGAIYPWDDLEAELSVTREALRRTFELLDEKGYAEAASMGSARITSAGILYAEEVGIANKEQISHNNTARFKMLDVLASVREEHGLHAMADWQSIVSETGIERLDFDRQYDLLRSAGLMENVSMTSFRITSVGFRKVTEWRQKLLKGSQFERLKTDSALSPQKRGHELEALLREVIKEEGWHCESNVRADGEENDLIIHRGTEYYLAECKWEASKTEPGQLGKLRDKVTFRFGARGLFFSMAGYTDNAVKIAEDRLEGCMILLFGPQDIQRLLIHKTTFTEALNAKFHIAMTKRKIAVE